MEDFFGFIIVVIGVVATIVNSSNKKKQQAAQQFPPMANMPLQPHAASEPPKAAPTAQPVSMATMLPPREEPQVAQPTVHTHLSPDCDVHDNSGSLNIKSPEGKDPCHETQLPPSVHQPQPEPVAQPDLTLDWTGDNLVKAFVMQEVLTRPSQRRAR